MAEAILSNHLCQFNQQENHLALFSKQGSSPKFQCIYAKKWFIIWSNQKPLATFYILLYRARDAEVGRSLKYLQYKYLQHGTIHKTWPFYHSGVGFCPRRCNLPSLIHAIIAKVCTQEKK